VTHWNNHACIFLPVNETGRYMLV